MSRNVLFVGVDVDDKAYHFSIVDGDQQILVQGKRCSRDPGRLKKAIEDEAGKSRILVGYEATFVGYTLARDLQKMGLECLVIAPSTIARAPGARVKNDRIDSLRLARGLARKEFSYVTIPTVSQESDRQLLRTREFLVQMRSDLKRHILSVCRTAHLDYKGETGKKAYWTAEHRKWLEDKVKTLPSSAHISLTVLQQQLEDCDRQIDTLDAEIDHVSKQEAYQKKVQALRAFKGIETTTAMMILTEIFDIKRFAHPRKLVSFCGLDISEYSSGGKQLQFGITKMGNKRLRKALVEACQQFSTSKTPSKRKKAARRETDAAMVRIADRCQARLYTKGHRLLAREKPRNKVKVACAREMVGFLWEALHQAA